MHSNDHFIQQKLFHYLVIQFFDVISTVNIYNQCENTCNSYYSTKFATILITHIQHAMPHKNVQ